MTRESRSSLAIGVAVFIAGGVLLGLEIASSRVLAPFFGNSLYVWGSLIGIVLAGLSLGYWLGGIVADRYPTPRLLVGLLGTAALLVLAIPFVDGWTLDRVVAWDPGPRLNPVIATILLFGLPSLVLGSVSPVAVRLKARSIEELGRTAGRLFAISTAGSIAGTFLTSFWLIPELGTDQVLASAAIALMLAAAAVALVERLAIAFALALMLAGVSVGAVVSLAPDKGGTVAASQLRNWSPVYRQRSLEDRSGGIEESQTGYKIVATKDSQYHRIAVVDDDTSRYLRFDSSFQSGMFLNDPYRTRFIYSDYLQLPFAYRAQTRRILYIGLGGGSAPKRDLARLPRRANRRRRARPGGRRHGLQVLRAAPRSPAGRRGRGRSPLRVRPRGPLGRDRDRCVLLRRDPIPPRDPGVSRARSVAADHGRARGHEHHWGRQRHGFASLPLDASHLPSRSLDVAIHPVVESGGNDLGRLNNIILVAGEGAAPSKQFLLDRWREVRRRSPGAPDLVTGNQGQRRCAGADPGRSGADDDYAPTDALLLLFDCRNLSGDLPLSRYRQTLLARGVDDGE